MTFQHNPGPYVWHAPIKPGLIPLQPLTVGNILGGTFQTIRRNPKATFGLALLVYGIVMLVTFLFVFFLFGNSFDEFFYYAAFAPGSQSFYNLLGLMILSVLPGIVLNILAVAIVQGVVSISVARDTLGEKIKVSGIFSLAKGRLGVLILYALLQVVAITVAIGLLLVIFVPIFGSLMASVPALALVLQFLLIIGAIIVTLWLYTKLSLVPSAIVIERKGIFDAIKRSWGLTHRFFWRTLGIQLLVNVIMSFVSQIVTTPFTFIIAILIALVAPTGDQDSALILVIALYLLLTLFATVISAITLVVQSSVSAILYIDLRMRKEGLNLHLVRYVENKQAGVSDNPDPYLMPAVAWQQQPYPAQGQPYPAQGQQPYTGAPAQPFAGQPYPSQQPYPGQYGQPPAPQPPAAYPPAAYPPAPYPSAQQPPAQQPPIQQPPAQFPPQFPPVQNAPEQQPNQQNPQNQNPQEKDQNPDGFIAPS